MSVSAPFNTSGIVTQNDVSPLDVTMTIAGGHSNTALIVWVNWNTAAVTISSVTWDPAGANQALTSIGAAVTLGTRNIQGFRLVNPTAGASKVVRIAYSASCDIAGAAAAYDSVDQTTPTASLTSNTTGAALTVTAVSGDATTTFAATSDTVTASNQTLIDTDAGFSTATGYDYALATGNMTHTWTLTGGAQMVVGVAVKAAAAAVTRAPGVGSELLTGQANILGFGIGMPDQP